MTSYSSLELQLFQIKLSSPVLCFIVYHPPKYNKDFLAGILVKYDHILILGDFNVHVCCESRPLVIDFLNLISSFHFSQCLSGPNHEGHILDLVLSLSSLSVSVDEICVTTYISDHLPVLFTLTLSCSVVKTKCPRVPPACH